MDPRWEDAALGVQFVLAVAFTAATVIGGIFFRIFSSLRFQAEMAQLLAILRAITVLGAVTVVPALCAIIRPRVASSRLEREPSDLGDPT